MRSPTYQLVLDAAKTRQQIMCDYHGHRREACPHVVGLGLRGEEMALIYQFGGTSSSGLPPLGEWRCLRLQEVVNLRVQQGAWHTDNSHLRPQSCVKQIEYEVFV
ncbi:MAG: hypothetical protein ACLP8A_16660 [Methylovirgula sp.]